MRTMKGLAHRLPAPLREPLRRIYGFALSLSPRERARNEWLRNDYGKFAMQEREYIFRCIARFCHINRPADGYYFEFGCHGGNTMRMAWKHSRFLFNWIYVGFDSFEGLPEIEEIDRQEIWEKGKLSTSERRFIELATSTGMPRERLRTVRGFYDKTLTPALAGELGPTKATVIYIDCDLYASTVPVLEFVRPFLRVGTIIVFDDWYCFNGDPQKGEQRAWKEFLARHPGLRFADFVQTGEAKAFICVQS
jgi:hypothetical protein